MADIEDLDEDHKEDQALAIKEDIKAKPKKNEAAMRELRSNLKVDSVLQVAPKGDAGYTGNRYKKVVTPLFFIFIIFALIWVITILITRFVAGYSVYHTLDVSINIACVVICLPVAISIMHDGTADSISGIIAQRLKPSSYLSVCFIMFFATSVSSLASTASDHECSKSACNDIKILIFILTYLSPLFMAWILIFPLIYVTTPLNLGAQFALHQSGDDLSENSVINLSPNSEFKILTHTSSESCAQVLHFLCVGSGVGCQVVSSGLYGYYEMAENPGYAYSLLVLLLIIIASGAVFMCMTSQASKDSNIFEGSKEDGSTFSINNDKRKRNRVRIFFEFVCLISVILSSMLISLSRLD
jgi:hypothetical protein